MAPRIYVSKEALQAAENAARRGDIEQAKRRYHQILAREPGHKKARKALKALQGDARGQRAPLSSADFQRLESLRKSNPAAARSEVAHLCRLHPEQPALHNLHGVLLAGKGDLAAACLAYRRALTLEPAYTDALSNLAVALAELGELDDALRCFEALLGRIDDDPVLHFNHGNVLLRNGQPAEAARAYGHAIRLRPLYVAAHNNLGNALRALDKPAGARASYERALAIDPGFKDAARNLARLARASEKPAEEKAEGGKGAIG
jgi:tetratricopeptide (TPR) repeat protein